MLSGCALLLVPATRIRSPLWMPGSNSWIYARRDRRTDCDRNCDRWTGLSENKPVPAYWPPKDLFLAC